MSEESPNHLLGVLFVVGLTLALALAAVLLPTLFLGKEKTREAIRERAQRQAPPPKAVRLAE